MANGWVSAGQPYPKYGTTEYTWWSRGAVDEATLRNEGLTPDARDVRDYFEGVVRHHQLNVLDALALTVRVYTAGMPLWRRLRWVWRALR